MLKLTLIRHFPTKGNLQKKYIGITDEPVCDEWKQKKIYRKYPDVQAVFVSPMRRCLETAKMIYPKIRPVIYEGFSEFNFGDFENKNYIELSTNEEYQKWIDSNGTLPFPRGEDTASYKIRNIKAFDEMINYCFSKEYESVSAIVHGGTIMSILDKYSHPHNDYFHWQVQNGNGYTAEIEANDRKLYNINIIY